MGAGGAGGVEGSQGPAGRAPRGRAGSRGQLRPTRRPGRNTVGLARGRLGAGNAILAREEPSAGSRGGAGSEVGARPGPGRAGVRARDGVRSAAGRPVRRRQECARAKQVAAGPSLLAPEPQFGTGLPREQDARGSRRTPPDAFSVSAFLLLKMVAVAFLSFFFFFSEPARCLLFCEL